MDKRAAKKNICHAAASLLSDHNNEFLYYDHNGEPYNNADSKRLCDALEDLVDELRRRGQDAQE